MVYREQNFSFPLNCKIAAYRGKEPQIFSTILPQPSQRLISRNPDTFQYARPPIYVYIYIGSLNKAATQFRIRLAIRGREEQHVAWKFHFSACTWIRNRCQSCRRSTILRKAKQRLVDEEVTLVIRCTNVELTLFCQYFLPPNDSTCFKAILNILSEDFTPFNFVKCVKFCCGLLLNFSFSMIFSLIKLSWRILIKRTCKLKSILEGIT